MQPIKKAFYIISAELSSLCDVENSLRTTKLENRLKLYGENFKQVIGSYKGSKELSFIVMQDEMRQHEQLLWLISLQKEFNQESILIVNEKRQAKLYYADTQLTQHIGKWQDSNIKEVKNLDAWTFCPQLEQYFKVA